MIEGGILEEIGYILIAEAVGKVCLINPSERKELAQVCCEVTENKTQMIFNCAHTDVRIVIDLAKCAYDNGANAIQLAP